ncbi:hypothetical protein E4U42_007589, partial [Claviceps africana]
PINSQPTNPFQVSLQKYIDDISTLGVECCLMEKLRNVFDPLHIYNMDDDQLQHLAAENPTATQERAKLTDKMQLLHKALHELRGLSQYRPQPKESRAYRKLPGLFVKKRDHSEG